MTDLDDIYSDKIMEFAARISHTKRLENPDASASAHSKLCGSKIGLDIKMDGDRITDFGQDVNACLLGQVSASIVAREIIGTTSGELRNVAQTMHDMLKKGGPPPSGRWQDLEILEPVKDYHARHASTLLVFTALNDAISQIENRSKK